MLENISRTKNLLHARARKNKTADSRLAFARAITRHVVAKCWQNTFSSPASPPPLLTDISPGSPGNSDFFLGSRFADEVSRLDTIFSSYLVGCLYTALIPRDMRGEFGVYYTPPAISRHLMELAEQAGTDWGSARVLDPACGGGAFLAPLARRMLQTLEGRNTEQKAHHIASHLAGLEIDPFAAWLSQVFLEIVFREDCPDFSDQIFRCINGSVAVSAYELEALPLPPHQELMRIEDMIQSSATNEHIENEIERFYATSPTTQHRRDPQPPADHLSGGDSEPELLHPGDVGQKDLCHEDENLAFVTAYMDRGNQSFRKTFSTLAWRSFAWCVTEPDNIIALHKGAEWSGLRLRKLMK